MNNIKGNIKNNTANRRFWMVMLVLINIGFLGFLVGGVVFGQNSYLLICVAFFVLSLPSYYQSIKKDKELFSPINLLFANLFIGVLLQTMILSFNLDLSRALPLDPVLDFDKLLTGSFAMIVAVLFLLIGYSFHPNPMKYRKNIDTNKSRLTAINWSRQRLVLLFFLFGGISFVCLSYFVISFDVLSDLSRFSVKRHSEDGGSAGILRFGMRFSQVACMILFAYHLSCKREGIKSGMVPLIFILFMLSLAGPIISSSRSLLLYFMIALFSIHHFSTGGWNLKSTRNALIVVVVIVSVMGALRFIQQRSVTLDTFNEEVGVVGSLSRLATSNNFLGIKKTSVLIDMVPSQKSHTFGSTYFLWIITPIPRAIWPEKPVVRIGGILGSQVFGTRDTNGIPPGFIGEAYLNFGWLGIPMVALLFGVGIRKFYELYGRSAYWDPRVMLIYAALFAPIVFASVSSDFTGFVSRSAQILLPLLIAMKYVGIRRAR